MVLHKFTKKNLKKYGGASKPQQSSGQSSKGKANNEADNQRIAATVTDRNIKDFKDEDFPKGWIVHDLYLAAPVKTEKDYIKQAIVVKRKKAEKKVKEEKFSTVTGIQTLKKSSGGLLQALQKGATQGIQNFNKVMQTAQSIGRAVTGKGKYGSMARGKLSKARASQVRASDKYSRAQKNIQKEKTQALTRQKQEFQKQVQLNPTFKNLGFDDPAKLKSFKGSNYKVVRELKDGNKIMKESILYHYHGGKKDNENKAKKFKKVYKIYENIKENYINNDDKNFIKITEMASGAIKDTLKEKGNATIDTIKEYLKFVSSIYLCLVQFILEYKWRIATNKQDGGAKNNNDDEGNDGDDGKDDEEDEKTKRAIMEIYHNIIKDYWNTFYNLEIISSDNYGLKTLILKENYKVIFKKHLDGYSKKKIGRMTNRFIFFKRVTNYYGYELIELTKGKNKKIFDKYTTTKNPVIVKDINKNAKSVIDKKKNDSE